MNFISLPKTAVEFNRVVPSSALSALNLPNFIGYSGLKLEDISPSQLSYFLAARALVPLIHELELPSTQSLAAQEKHSKFFNQSSNSLPNSQMEFQRHPSDLFTFGAAKVSELKYVLPHQLCYPEETLLYLLQNGKIQRRKMIKISEEASNENRNRETELGSADSSKISCSAQRAYLLLDVSQSMNGDRSPDRKVPDRRGVIARGLGLAFIYDAKERETQVHFRPFSTAVGKRASARVSREMAPIVSELIQLSNLGSTALQAGLEAAAKDLFEIDQGARVDIMLITDGISHLSGNPVVGKHLHTFLIGDSVPPSSKGQGGVLDKLTDWSETFKRIWDQQFAEFLAPRADDIYAFEALLVDCAGKLPYCTGTEELRQIMRITELADEIAKLSSKLGKIDASALNSLSAKNEALKQELASPEFRNEILARDAAFQESVDMYNANLPKEYRIGADFSNEADLDNISDSDLSMHGTKGNSSVSIGLAFRVLYRKVMNYLRRYF